MDPQAAAPDPTTDLTSDLTRTQRVTATDHLLRIAHDERQRDDVRRSAREAAIVINLPVASTIAGRHRGRGIPLEDLEQVAYAALVRCADGFDPDRGRDFLAYAVPSISGEVKRWFRDRGWTVRPPRSVQESQSKVVAARDELEASLGRPPHTRELAERVGLDEHTVTAALSAQGCFHPVSLDAPTGAEGSGSLGERVSPDSGFEDEALTRAVVEPALARLDQEDRLIVRMRWYEERTQQEIADRLGTTQVQVSRRISRILEELRSQLTPRSFPPAA